MSLIIELRRRRVFRTAALYVVAAWVVLQVASLAFPALEIPEAAIRYVWVAAFLGFPVALVFGWRYQITADGIVRTMPIGGGDTAQELGLKMPDYALLSALVLILGVIGYRAGIDIVTVEKPFGVSAFGREIHHNSIAILPFDNLTGDAGQEYFVDGIKDSITSVISQVSALRVKSSTSTSTYKGSPKGLTAIASELGVANIIEGSVFRTGDQLRITVQLIDAATDEHIWAESYDREVRDLLALQSELAREVANRIGVELTPDEVTRLAAARQVNPEVYDTYLKGLHFVKRLEPGAVTTGLDYLHDAVGIDPREPLAYAGIALAYNTIGHGVNAHGAFPKAIAAAEKALTLDEWSGEAWAALAEAVLYYEWDWAAAEGHMQRALQLSPNLDHVYAHYAYLLILLGRHEEAIAASEKARDLSPVDPLWAGFTAWLYMVEGRWEEALETAEECIAFSTQLDLCRYALGQIYAAQGEFDKSVEVQELMSEQDPFRAWGLAISYAQAGRSDEAMDLIEALSINATPRNQLHIALAYSAMGDTEQALVWLNTAYESRSDWLPWIVLPYAYGGSVEPIRDEPGYQAIVQSLNLPPTP